jgi:hypothetical protein
MRKVKISGGSILFPMAKMATNIFCAGSRATTTEIAYPCISLRHKLPFFESKKAQGQILGKPKGTLQKGNFDQNGDCTSV